MTSRQNRFSASFLSICALGVVMAFMFDSEEVGPMTGVAVPTISARVEAQRVDTSVPDASMVFAGGDSGPSEEPSTF